MCEKDFELVCETVISTANFIIAQQGFERPKESKETVIKLAQNNIIPNDLADRLTGMIGFRNLLVHRYGNVDDAQAYTYLKEDIRDAHDLLQHINQLLEEE